MKAKGVALFGRIAGVAAAVMALIVAVCVPGAQAATTMPVYDPPDYGLASSVNLAFVGDGAPVANGAMLDSVSLSIKGSEYAAESPYGLGGSGRLVENWFVQPDTSGGGAPLEPCSLTERDFSFSGPVGQYAFDRAIKLTLPNGSECTWLLVMMPQRTITAKVQWKGGDKALPKGGIKLNISADGKQIDKETKTVSAENDWSATWRLPKYKKLEDEQIKNLMQFSPFHLVSHPHPLAPIEYSVKQAGLPQGFRAAPPQVSASAREHFEFEVSGEMLPPDYVRIDPRDSIWTYGKTYEEQRDAISAGKLPSIEFTEAEPDFYQPGWGWGMTRRFVYDKAIKDILPGYNPFVDRHDLGELVREARDDRQDAEQQGQEIDASSYLWFYPTMHPKKPASRNAKLPASSMRSATAKPAEDGKSLPADKTSGAHQPGGSQTGDAPRPDADVPRGAAAASGKADKPASDPKPQAVQSASPRPAASLRNASVPSSARSSRASAGTDSLRFGDPGPDAQRLEAPEIDAFPPSMYDTVTNVVFTNTYIGTPESTKDTPKDQPKKTPRATPQKMAATGSLAGIISLVAILSAAAGATVVVRRSRGRQMAK